MKLLKRLMIIIASVCLLCGCTKSNIISPEADENLPQPGADGIVWEQLWDDFREVYEDTDIYPFIETVNGGVYPEENMIRFFLLTNTEISGEEAAEYATEVLKGFNDLISEQNSSFAPSSEDSYGGYVSKHDIYVMVSPDDGKGENANWILEDTIPAGEYREVDPEAVPVVE